jgi:hypothetical protein
MNLTETTVKAPFDHAGKRPLWTSICDVLNTAIWLLLWLSFLPRMYNGPDLHPVAALVAFFLGAIVSDAFSGVFHWFFDTFLDERTPVVGMFLVAPFREHHRDPLALTRHGFFELIGNSCLGLLPFMLLAWWFGPVEPTSPAGVFGYMILLTFSFAVTTTNQFHSWAHMSARPRVAGWLQRCGLIISPEHHARHHTPPHRTDYCVTNGWFNPVATRISLFVHAERVLVGLGVPRREL